MKPKLTIDTSGNKRWRLPSGEYHREDGPAIEWNNGDTAWYINGLCHREDGPAIEYYNGDKSWYINSISYTEQEHRHEIRSRKLKLLL
jgi:hypothetical protein